MAKKKKITEEVTDEVIESTIEESNIPESTEPLPEITEENVADEKIAISQENTEKENAITDEKPKRKRRTKKVEVPAEDVVAVGDNGEATPLTDVVPEIKGETVVADVPDGIDINKPIWVYPTSVAKKATKVISGKIYLWDDKEVTGRYAITDKVNGAGNLSALCGWVDASDIK